MTDELENKLIAIKKFINNNKDLDKFLEKSTAWSDSYFSHLINSKINAIRVAYAFGGFAFLCLIALICLL
ncbi:MAG: hypothetical protein LEGION0398_MBIBDBAK_01422 [Legionellaceae bacterium]